MSRLTNRKKKPTQKGKGNAKAKAYNDKMKKSGSTRRTVSFKDKRSNDGLTTSQRVEKQRMERSGGKYKKGATMKSTKKRYGI